jgi:hypothetical protein
MYQGGNTNTNVVVFYKDNGTKLSDDDCIRILGTSDKPQQYSNAFSATISSATIDAYHIEKIDCAYVINPPKKTVFVDEEQQEGGITLSLNKIELSDKNTRAYLTVSSNKNNTEDVHFYDFQSKAVQGDRQFATTYSFDVDYPKIKSDILPGITERGVVLFEPLNHIENHTKFIFEAGVGYGENHRFTFDLDLVFSRQSSLLFSLAFSFFI